nr:MAG TPA: hypothetical protein [Caudoviricetes sp.]
MSKCARNLKFYIFSFQNDKRMSNCVHNLLTFGLKTI